MRRCDEKAWAKITEPSGWVHDTNIGVLLHRAARRIEELERALKVIDEMADKGIENGLMAQMSSYWKVVKLLSVLNKIDEDARAALHLDGPPMVGVPDHSTTEASQ